MFDYDYMRSGRKRPDPLPQLIVLFFNDTATTENYAIDLPYPLPNCVGG